MLKNLEDKTPIKPLSTNPNFDRLNKQYETDKKKHKQEVNERERRKLKHIQQLRGNQGVNSYLRKKYTEEIKNLPKSDRKLWLKKHNITEDQLFQKDTQNEIKPSENSGCLGVFIFVGLFIYISKEVFL